MGPYRTPLIEIRGTSKYVDLADALKKLGEVAEEVLPGHDIELHIGGRSPYSLVARRIPSSYEDFKRLETKEPYIYHLTHEELRLSSDVLKKILKQQQKIPEIMP